MRTRFLVPGLWSLVVAAGPAVAATHATPTPTARPRLSGGFGRPRATVTPGDSASGGQSLADVVRAAHEGPPEKAASGEHGAVVIDNRSLVTDPNKGRVSTSRIVRSPTPKAIPRAPDAPGTAATATTAAPGAAAAPGGEAAPTEAEWRGIADADRRRVADAKGKVAELEATTKKLENDFYAWDDGQYRDRVIKPAWDRSRQQLDDAKAELAAAEKELADLPEKARKAGALPGWIRE